MEASQMDQSQVERVRQDAEERARQEINQKLEQVNIFLQVFYGLMWRESTAEKISHCPIYTT